MSVDTHLCAALDALARADGQLQKAGFMLGGGGARHWLAESRRHVSDAMRATPLCCDATDAAVDGLLARIAWVMPQAAQDLRMLLVARKQLPTTTLHELNRKP